MKKKEDIHDYCSAAEAAQILSRTHGRPIRRDYVSQMAKCKRKYTIRKVSFNHYALYHRDDLANCTITHKAS
jgi:hypothetical protein